MLWFMTTRGCDVEARIPSNAFCLICLHRIVLIRWVCLRRVEPEDTKQILLSRTGVSILVGGFAGVLGTVAGQPLDTVKVWRQTSARASRATWSTALADMGGWSGLMRGTVPASVARFAISGWGFSLLSMWRSTLSHQWPATFPTASPESIATSGASPLFTTFCAASLSGVCLTGISQPLELVKIQLQASAQRASTSSTPGTDPAAAPRQWRGSTHCAADLIQRHGWRSMLQVSTHGVSGCDSCLSMTLVHTCVRLPMSVCFLVVLVVVLALLFLLLALLLLLLVLLLLLLLVLVVVVVVAAAKEMVV